ncbi:MAG: DUF4349 domain-containing protein [Clostridia bacterium]|nr:DUF4349 domain-containing protein [Clostridia bacterium]
MKNRKLTLALVFVLLFSLALASCGASNKATADSDGYYNGGTSYDKSESFMPESPMTPDMPMEPSLDGDYGYKGGYDAPTADSITGGSVVGDAAQMSEKIIRNVSIDAQTKEYDKAIDEIRAEVALLGGFEESFHSSGRNYYQNGVYSRSAYMMLRLPAAQLDAFLGKVGGMVNVLSQSSNAQNVTGEYYDIQARISVLESERAAYEEMLKQSMDIDYLLQVKDRLYNVIEEIESYETRLKLLDSKVAYSTVTISLAEVIEYTPVITEEPTFGERTAEAFKTSWKNFAQGCQNFAIWFVFALPTLLVLAVIATVATVVVVRIVRKRRRALTPTAPKAPVPDEEKG